MTLVVPRTSFVIPARNAGQTLAGALDSVLAQSDDDWEALVVDDGSIDETAAIIAAYAQRDARFIALRGSGGEGVSAARNVGLRQACGRRVVFLDSDDWVAPAFLARMHAALDNAPGAVAAYCGYHRVMPDGALAPVDCDPEVARAPFDTFARTCAVAIHAVLVERQRVLDAGAFDSSLRTCEDWDLWQRVARLGGAWVPVAERLAFYRTSPNSLSQDAQRVLADGAIVIRRGFADDPRLRAAASDYAAGATRAHGMTLDIALAYFALSCWALVAVRGQPGARALELLDALPAASDHAPYVATTLFDAVMVSLVTAPQQLAARWSDYGPPITALIDTLGRIWNDPVAARRAQYAFERLVLNHDDLAAPRRLALTLGLRVDLRALTAVTPPKGVDRFYVYLCDGAQILALTEIGTLGTFPPRHWIEIAATRLGWREVMRRAAPSVARSLTPRRLLDATRAAGRAVRLSARPEQSWRDVVRMAARDAVVAVVAPANHAGDHADELQRLREQAAATTSLAPGTEARADETGATQQPVLKDRRAYWEALFRKEDPWNYGSAYEQEKYDLQLELLPEGPIETAVELACAEGRFTEKLAPRVQQLIATDISATALARAAERCRGKSHIDFRRIDLVADELPQGADLIVCSEVLYFLDDEAALRRVAERMAAALKPGGHIITAHALVLQEDMTRTGFDWGHPWGATTISRVFAGLPTLVLERSLCTGLYRIDRFARRDAADSAPMPRIEMRPIEADIEHEVARHIVWGGARARRDQLAKTERHHRIPVLAYHRIADSGPLALARYRVGAEAFGAQMSWLRKNGYHAIVADELAWFLEHQHPFVGRPVMITFDDGYQDFADAAWPLLRRHDLRAEVFIVTDFVGGRAEWDRNSGAPAPLMDERTIAALANQGARFGSHLASHRGADGLSTRQLAEELLRSQGALALWTGLTPCAVAAPFGISDQRLQRLAAECGYRIGFSTESAAADLSGQPMHLPRLEVRGDMALREFVSLLDSCR